MATVSEVWRYPVKSMAGERLQSCAITEVGLEGERRWLGRSIRAGDAQLEATDRCERCKVITMDPDTTEAVPELLRLLVERHDERMGMYCRVVRPGRVDVGDFVG